MLSVIMLTVVMLSVVAPYRYISACVCSRVHLLRCTNYFIYLRDNYISMSESVCVFVHVCMCLSI